MPPLFGVFQIFFFQLEVHLMESNAHADKCKLLVKKRLKFRFKGPENLEYKNNNIKDI